MSAPRYLWSGDWEQDSAAHAEALARRNAQRAAEPPEEEAPPEARTAGAAADAVARASRRAEVPRPVPAQPLGPTLGERLAALGAAVGRGLLALLRWIGLAVVTLFKGLRATVRGGWRALKRADRARLRLAAVAVLLIAVVAVGAVVLFGSSSSANANVAAQISSVSRWLGIQLSQVPNRGVVMEYVEPSGVAANEGFEPGDTIEQIDNRPINGLGDVAKAFHGVQPGNQIAITVEPRLLGVLDELPDALASARGSMSFAAPVVLIALVAIPLLVWWYVGFQSRRERAAAAFVTPAMTPSVAPSRPGWRRHAPMAAFALALAVLIVAAARPAVEGRRPGRRGRRVPRQRRLELDGRHRRQALAARRGDPGRPHVPGGRAELGHRSGARVHRDRDACSSRRPPTTRS